jgi:hypothetical protein
MVDKVMTDPRDRVAKKTGRLPVAALQLLDQALRLWIGIRARYSRCRRDPIEVWKRL